MRNKYSANIEKYYCNTLIKNREAIRTVVIYHDILPH